MSPSVILAAVVASICVGVRLMAGKTPVWDVLLLAGGSGVCELFSFKVRPLVMLKLKVTMDGTLLEFCWTRGRWKVFSGVSSTSNKAKRFRSICWTRSNGTL